MSKINVKNFGILHPYVFYHNDMDGKTAAWLLHDHFCEMRIPDSPSDYQHYNYDGDMKLGSLNQNTVTYIVDLSFTDKTYTTLLDICNRSAHVIWIDHHDSSIDLLKNHPEILKVPNLNVFVSKDACGAVLTAIYLFGFIDKVHPLEDNYQKNREQSIHRSENWYDPDGFEVLYSQLRKDDSQGFVKYRFFYDGVINVTDFMFADDYLLLVDDHDRHTLRFVETRPFIEGTKLENTSIVYKTIDNKIEFNTEFWGYLDKTAYDYVNDGNLIIKYQNNKNANELSQCFEYIDSATGAKIICKNDRGSSYNFLELYDKYDAVCLFRYDGKAKRWFYSLFNRKDKTFNCAKFCERYGGGGHAHAAGCDTEKLIFDI